MHRWFLLKIMYNLPPLCVLYLGSMHCQWVNSTWGELSQREEVVGMTWCFLCSSCCSSQAHFGSKLSYAQGMGRSCSQNHTELWRLAGTSGDHWVQSPAQDLVQLSFEYLPRWWYHSPSGQPVPEFDHPHGRKVSSYAWIGFPVFQNSCPLPLVLSPLRRVWLSSLLPHHVFLHIDECVCKDVMGDTVKSLTGVKTCQYTVGQNMTSVMMVSPFSG